MERDTAQLSDLPRVVLDTSVLIGVQRHWLWLLAYEGYFEAVWSTFIVGEVVRIRVERAIAHGVTRDIYRWRINNLVHRLSDVMLLANYRSIVVDGALSDPDDDPILATALAARASYIVSLNTADFPADGEMMGVRFVTPPAFLAFLGTLYPDTNLKQRAVDVGKHLP